MRCLIDEALSASYDESSYPPLGETMRAVKIAITLAEDLVRRLDELVRDRQFPNRSRAVQEAVRDKLARMDRTRLARECAKLDPKEEQAMADAGVGLDTWPEY